MPGLLIFIDFEKAFDSLEWNFLYNCLDVFNFGPNFKRWIKTFYANIKSCVVNKKKKTKTKKNWTKRSIWLSLHSKCFCLVSEQKKPRNGIFRFDHVRNKTRAKKRKRGEGEGREGNACRQTPRFWKPAFASERSAWLARLVKQYWHVSIKGLFRTERSCMVRDTHLPAVVVYSGRQNLPSNARAFSLTSLETQSSSCDYMRSQFQGCH